MKAKGMSQGALADVIGVSRATINNYLCGDTPMTIDRADQIAEILGVTLADLVADDKDKQALNIGRQLRDADIPDLIRRVKMIIKPFME
jgi:transcriptional regulator with XRE-family HTH domain